MLDPSPPICTRRQKGGWTHRRKGAITTVVGSAAVTVRPSCETGWPATDFVLRSESEDRKEEQSLMQCCKCNEPEGRRIGLSSRSRRHSHVHRNGACTPPRLFLYARNRHLPPVSLRPATSFSYPKRNVERLGGQGKLRASSPWR